MRTIRFARRVENLILRGEDAASIPPQVIDRVLNLVTPSTATVAADRNVDMSKCDTALPQDWYDLASSLSGLNPQGHVVWSYEYNTVFGLPQALTPEGDLIVALVQLGSPITNEIHDDNRALLQSLIGNALRTMRQED